MTIDTTVTNGRFVGPDDVFEHTVSIHNGLVLETAETTDVWRTIDASGHLVFPGMLQPGALTGDMPLKLARRGVTTVLLSDDSPVENAAIDHLSPAEFAGRVVQITDPDAVHLARGGQALIQVHAALLDGPDSDAWWEIVANETLAVHVIHGDDPDFPLLQFLYHQGQAACGLSPARIAAVTSTIPARCYGVHPEKGTFQSGSHGDVVVFDPDTGDPYHDSAWPGRVIMSIQRGNLLLYNGQIHAAPGSGQTLTP